MEVSDSVRNAQIRTTRSTQRGRMWAVVALCAAAGLILQVEKCVALSLEETEASHASMYASTSRFGAHDDDDKHDTYDDDDGDDDDGGDDDYDYDDYDDDDDAPIDEVGMTEKAAYARFYRLRKKRRKGLIIKREASLTEVMLPGARPRDYRVGDLIPMYTDVVKSKSTLVPFKYLDLPICPAPADSMFRPRRKNLGARLQGLSESVAAYDINVNLDLQCTALCEVKIPPRKVRWMRKLVERRYRVHLTLDELPVLVRSKELNYAVRGYPVGFKAPPAHTGLNYDEIYLYNHLKFNVFYHLEDEMYRITGFDVHPVSVEHLKGPETGFVTRGSHLDTCNPYDSPSPINDPRTYLALRSPLSGEDLSVIYSYQVLWIRSKIEWADRWDVYVIGNGDIHYFYACNSIVVILSLAVAIANILIQAFRRDIDKYRSETKTELEEPLMKDQLTGWKRLHGDVFRPPASFPRLLSVIIGTGTQLGVVILSTVVCAAAGFFNLVERDQTITVALGLYALTGLVAGYVSCRLYAFFEGKHCERSTVLTAVVFPGVLVGFFVLRNVILCIAGAGSAVSIRNLFEIVLLWTFVFMPLVYLGSRLGSRKEKLAVPTKTNEYASAIPAQPLLCCLPMSMLLAGIPPFCSLYTELGFIMKALWLDQVYYEVGIFLATVLIVGLAVSMVSVLLCYQQLRREDHRWWWKSFWNGASVGAYIFLYSLCFLYAMQLVGVWSIGLYLMSMLMISTVIGLICGAIGVLSSFWFITLIYAVFEVDK